MSMPHPARNNPFQVMLLGASVTTGIAGLIMGSAAGGTITQLLPPIASQLFFALILIGGGVGLVGCYLRTLYGPGLERAGLMLLGTEWTAYGLVILAHGRTGLMSALALFAFAWASWWRTIQISRALHSAQATVKALQEEHPGGES